MQNKSQKKMWLQGLYLLWENIFLPKYIQQDHHFLPSNDYKVARVFTRAIQLSSINCRNSSNNIVLETAWILRCSSCDWTDVAMT